VRQRAKGWGLLASHRERECARGLATGLFPGRERRWAALEGEEKGERGAGPGKEIGPRGLAGVFFSSFFSFIFQSIFTSEFESF